MKKIKIDNKIITDEKGAMRELKNNKPNFMLLIPEEEKYENIFLYKLASHLTQGAKKYSERNWEKFSTKEELESLKSSAFRHFLQWICNEEDEDHFSAVFFNMIASEKVKSKLKKGEK